MDTAEERAYEFLKSAGYSDIRYEPVQNRPPDFLVEHSIAVEVTRLAQRDRRRPLKPRPLDEDFIRFEHALRDVLNSFPLDSGGTRWLSAYYARPIPSIKRNTPAIWAFLERISRGEETVGATLELSDTTYIEYRLHSPSKPAAFMMASFIDQDAHPFADFAWNLNFVIDSKAKKIRPYRDQYPEWWLVLIDTLTYAIPQSDIGTLDRSPSWDAWDRIVLVNPITPERHLILK